MHEKFPNLLPVLRNLFLRDTNKIALGRWSLVHDEKLYRRTDLSNEDHCGPCGEYVLQKRRDKKDGYTMKRRNEVKEE